MSARFRFVVALAMIVLIGIPTLAITLAQQPDDQLPTLELPDLPDLKFPERREANPRVQQIIRSTLNDGDHAETGDPVLDDILQVIKNRRSILEGSALESIGDEHSLKKKAELVSAQARAAECLLKAARVLEKIEPSDKSRQDLVNQMRRESVRLLKQ